MCLSPRSIVNNTKYVSLLHKDKFVMEVPCGVCAECQTTMANQWYYRTYYEWSQTEMYKGYVLFDTLTYDNDHLPHLSKFWQFVSSSEDFPCFNYSDIRLFLQALRQRVSRAGYDPKKLRYFLSSEYGTSDTYVLRGRVVKATHRPHYHVLFFVNDSHIDPLWLSQTIAEVWNTVSTTAIPYFCNRLA